VVVNISLFTKQRVFSITKVAHILLEMVKKSSLLVGRGAINLE